MTLQHPLFTLIKEEHLAILKMAAELEAHMELKPVLSEKLHHHHANEETLLFPKLNAHPQICMGGPMCSYFFDDQITSPPIAKAQDITKLSIETPAHLEDLWHTHSPLRIPAGEHLALKHLLDCCSPDLFLKNLNAFIKIMKGNFQKEEQCLFHVCCQLLNKDALDTIYTEWAR